MDANGAASNAASWAAVVVAAVAAVIVLYQSVQIRRSAGASRDAVIAANRALELSSQQVAEATRMRIDASMPQLLVQARREPLWPPLAPEQFANDQPQPFPCTGEFAVMHLPKHSGERIMIRAEAAITNESDRHVELVTSPLFDAENKTYPNPLPRGRASV